MKIFRFPSFHSMNFPSHCSQTSGCSSFVRSSLWLCRLTRFPFLSLPALSSLSSQSPPSSPFIASSSENPPPLLPAQAAHPTDLSLPPQHEAAKADKTPSDSQHATEAEAEPVYQSGDESESQSLGGPWEMKAWPEGRQVLTHLVEGFVIQEGLQPFPVRTQRNRSSLNICFLLRKPLYDQGIVKVH